MSLLSREQILGAQDLTHEDVKVPEWGGTVRVRTMTGEERDAYETAIYGGEKVDVKNVRAKLLAIVICDEKGERMFTEEDVAALGKKSVRALQRIFLVAQKLNAISEEALKDLAKNSGGGPGAALPTS